MERALRSLNWKYAIFIGSIAALIIANGIVIRQFQDGQAKDALMVNQAGRLRMLSQRITKYAVINSFYSVAHFEKDNLKDSVMALEQNLQKSYEVVMNNCRENSSPEIVLLLEHLKPGIDSITWFVHQMPASGDFQSAEEFISNLRRTDEDFLSRMETIVFRLQLDSEQKVKRVETIQILLSIAAVITLIFEFIYFFRPTVKRTNIVSRKLMETNRELAMSEEELRATLDHVTELKKGIEESEQYYRHIVEEATDAIYELNERGEFMFVNEVMVRLSGFSRARLKDMRFLDLIHPDDRQQITDYYRSKITEGREVEYQEFRIINIDNEIIWIGQNIKVNHDNDGKPIGVSAVARNISQLRAIRDQLLRSESLYRLLTDNQTDVVMLTGEDRRLQYISKSCKEVLGYESSELLGTSLMTLIPKEEQERLTEIGNELRSTGTPISAVQFNLQRKDGSLITVEAQSKPFYNERGEKLVQSSFRDITARKFAEAKLQESERLYRLLSDNMQDLVSLTTVDARFTYLSPSVRKMLGYEPEELVGTLTYDLVHPSDLTDLKSDHNTRRDKKFADPVKPFRIRKKDGSYIWIEALAFPITDKNGDVTLIQTTSRNINERKKFEQELVAASRKAESAASAKSQFLSMMSHEIRTPMNAILGLTNLLLDKETDVLKKEKLQLMKTSEDHLLTIINDILDFNRIEADKIHLEEVGFNFRMLGSDIVKLTRHQAGEKGLEVKYDYDNDLSDFFLGDPVRIGQVITNLLGNAIKFTHHGSVRLSVRTQLDEAEYSNILIEVIDTGIGIPEDKKASIFESFTQAENTTTRVYGGTGLGLAITQKLVKLMKGEIGVQSKVASGSRFFVHLRLKKATGTNTGTLSSNYDSKKILGKKILLVEDNILNQLVAREYLEQWGLIVTEAMNGQDALRLVEENVFDLILLDLQMPGVSGYETAQTIRSMAGDRFQQVPIIALTASATNDVKGKTLAVGMNDHVSKPFEPNKLRQVIEKYIDNNRSNFRERLANDFDKHSNGKKELRDKLLRSAIDNMLELKLVFDSMRQSTPGSDAFSRVAHKTKMAVSFINDQDLTNAIQQANAVFKSHDFAGLTDELVSNFNHTLDNIISDLRSLS